MNRPLLNTLFWAFWWATAALNGVLAGYMVSHSIMLGRFFNWFLESGNEDLLHRTYSVFRASSNAYRVYDIPLLLHLVVAGAWVVLAFAVRRQRAIAVVAGLATYWVSVIFLGTGMGTAEDAVLAGTADVAATQQFLALNLPVHTTFAVIYVVSLLLMLLVPLRERTSVRRLQAITPPSETVATGHVTGRVAAA